ncbi:hypothetical protein ABZX68_06425 [Streptomyces cellulosae]
MTHQTTDRPFADEPTDVLRAALGLATRHAEQATRFRPTQPGDALPAVVDLLRAELQHREGTLLPPPEGPEYTPCSSCTHIEPDHQPDAGRCLECDCRAYAPAAVSAAVAPPTQAAPSLRAGLRDEIVKALGRITTVPPVAHRREQADHVLAVLYREWPWLRAEAEDAEPTDKAAVLREVADELTRKANKLTERVHDLAYFVAKDRLREAEILDREATALRRMADETATEESDGARLATLETDLADGPVRCPLCPTPLTLHTPSGARAHFTTVHPEQRITGRESGPWPLLVADETATETQARRGDAFEQWLKARRDEWAPEGCQPWQILDQTLEEYRLHADTGTPLGEHVCEGKAVGDCECLEQPAAGARQGETPDAQTQPATPMTAHLTTPCDACNHTLNWHSSGETGCTVLRCACARYYHAAGQGQDGNQP